MRIAVFTDSCLPYCSGVTYAVLSQVNELCERGHEVTIFRPKPGRKFRNQKIELPANATLRDIPVTLPAPRLPELRLVFPTIATSLSYLRQFRPDVVHVHTEWGSGWEGMICAKLLGVPVVGTFHTFFADPGYLKSIGLPSWRWVQSVMWAYVRGFFNRCDLVTSPSESVRRALLDHHSTNDPVVISNGIRDPQRVSEKETTALREKYGITGPSFIYVGRVAPEKSLEVLVDAFNRVQTQLPDAKLVIVGDGPSMPALNEQIAQLGLEEKVVRLGFVPNEDLIAQQLFALGDVFVTPSKTENQPVSVLESMSFGVPVIAARAKGLAEMVEHGVNGFGFFPDDVDGLARTMVNFVESDSQREQLIEGAMDYAGQHSLRTSVERLERHYHQLAHRAQPAMEVVHTLDAA